MEKPLIVGASGSHHRATVHEYYNPAVLFKMRPDVIEGFLILLSAPEADQHLAYYAILDGNVLDTCLDKENQAAIERTKAFLSRIDQEAYQHKLVQVYSHLFTSLRGYHQDLDNLCCGCHSDCGICQMIYKQQYQRTALASIEAAFAEFEYEITR